MNNEVKFFALFAIVAVGFVSLQIAIFCAVLFALVFLLFYIKPSKNNELKPEKRGDYKADKNTNNDR
jgi:MFS superfamily sulfate permease-like transporter